MSESITSADVGVLKTVEKAPRAAALKRELEERKAQLEALIAPAREYYERHVNDEKYLEAKRIIKELSPELGQVHNELAVLARLNPTNKSLKVESGNYSRS